MQKLNVGYFKSFGTKEITEIADQFKQEHPDIQVNLLPIYQDQVADDLKSGNIDLALTDPRDHDFSEYQVTPITQESLVVLLQAGNFMKGQQTVELNDLSQIPNLIVAKPEEEAGELHYHRDILKVASPFIAVDSFNEASLMATSGSGYFLMNERTAPLLDNDQLQKIFLLKQGKQLRQSYVAVSTGNELSNKFIKDIKEYFQGK